MRRRFPGSHYPARTLHSPDRIVGLITALVLLFSSHLSATSVVHCVLERIQRLVPERRRATLAAIVIEKQAAITDLAIDMFCKLIGSTRRKAEISQKERRLKAAEVLEVVALDHIKLGRLIFGAFSFRAFRVDEPVLLAVDHLRALYRGRKLPSRVPLDFMSRKWQRRVSPRGGNTDFQAWEVAVFVHLRDRLKTGDIWIDGSRAWRSFEDYLLPRHIFNQMRAKSRLGLAIPDNFSEWLAERTATLNAKLKALANATADHAIPDAEISDNGLSISPIREEESDRIITLSRKLYTLVPRIKITSLLAEVHSWTRFLDCFTHYRTGEQAEDEASLMEAILADATNAGAER